jgi:hypothetical protein
MYFDGTNGADIIEWMGYAVEDTNDNFPDELVVMLYTGLVAATADSYIVFEDHRYRVMHPHAFEREYERTKRWTFLTRLFG